MVARFQNSEVTSNAHCWLTFEVELGPGANHITNPLEQACYFNFLSMERYKTTQLVYQINTMATNKSIRHMFTIHVLLSINDKYIYCTDETLIEVLIAESCSSNMFSRHIIK